MDQVCGKRRHEPLATTYAHVEVQFAGQFLSEGIQNDASHLLDRPELYDGGRHGLEQVGTPHQNISPVLCLASRSC